jgi:hypothetical protein
LNLRALRLDAADTIEDLLEAFSPGLERTALVEFQDELTQAFLTVAAASLLVDGSTDFFHLSLVRCAENGRRLLSLCRHRCLDLLPASRNAPLLAALAAGDWARADAIAAISRDTRAPEDGEDEDEFVWAQVLQVLARSGEPDAAAMETHLAALEQASPDAYFDRMRAGYALLRRDRDAFEEAFAGSQVAFGTDTEERAKALTTPVTTSAPHRFLWFEGLALLRLAERREIAVRGEYRYCPRLARLPMTVTYVGDWAVTTGLAPGPI